MESTENTSPATPSAHTPGFWKPYSIGRGNPDRYMGPWESDERYMVGAFVSLTKPTTSKTICLLDPLRECEANAHLIAAAPELLEHLENIVEMAHSVSANWESGDLAEAVRSLDRIATSAEVAIAKAKGKAA